MILKENKIHPEVVLNITPGMVGIYQQCLREGLIETFVEAEATVPPPACGMCNASNTPLSSGDICISTGYVQLSRSYGQSGGRYLPS